MENAALESRKQGLLVAAGLFLAALLVRTLVPPWTHYTYNDEYLYLRHASELRSSGAFSFANQPPMLVYIYALAFRFFPMNAHTTFAITSVVGSLTVPALYGCLRSLSVERTIAVLAAMLLLLHPLHVKHSGAGSLEVMSLLFVVSTVGSFSHWLRVPGAASLFAFAACLLAALTTRIENFVLVPILMGLGVVYRERARRPSTLELSVVAIVVAAAASYLPAILSFHDGQAGEWKSELGALGLLVNNLGFWVGGSLDIGKVPFLLLAGGVVGSWRSDRFACVTWLALLLAYSAIYVVHGVNLGYHHESGHEPYFAARAGGHDMFRFNVLLVPAIVFFTASGVVAWLRLIDWALSRVTARAAGPVSALVLLSVGALLLGINGEYRAYDPLGFVRSPYNRPVERAEYAFLEAAFADLPRPVRCYTLPSPTEPFLGDGIEMIPVDGPDEVRVEDDRTFLYVNSAQLLRPATGATFQQIVERFQLDPVARENTGRVELQLLRVRSRS